MRPERRPRLAPGWARAPPRTEGRGGSGRWLGLLVEQLAVKETRPRQTARGWAGRCRRRRSVELPPGGGKTAPSAGASVVGPLSHLSFRAERGIYEG